MKINFPGPPDPFGCLGRAWNCNWVPSVRRTGPKFNRRTLSGDSEASAERSRLKAPSGGMLPRNGWLMAYLKISIPLLILTLAAGASPACAIERDRSRSDLPNLMFWAWERSEDLRFIDPNKVGVAYLVATLQLTSTGVEAIPRRQPLKVPEGTRLMGVIRVQAEPG